MDPSCTEHPYRLLEKIGEDGSGATYRAHHENLDRIEAVKILPPPRSSDDEFIARLRQTAKAMAMLAHPHIATVYGYGRLQDERFYLAMEHLEGESLQELVGREGALPQRLTARLLYQLASAIAHAHEHGLVHRNLSPSNIHLIDRDGSAPNLKVRDFGFAAILESTKQASSSLSEAGTLYGSPRFMAPERATGKHSDPSVDIYSFGCVAYMLITGQPPGGQPFVNTPGTAGTSELRSVVLRCLERDPSARYADGRALRDALELLSGFHGESTWSQSGTRRRATTVQETATTVRRKSFPIVKTVVDDPQVQPDLHAEHADLLLAEQHYHTRLLNTAEAMLASGRPSPDLQTCVASVRRANQALEDQDRAREQLHMLGDTAYRKFRRQESLIRFELGELSFQLAEGASSLVRTHAEARLNELTEELVRAEYLHARELQAIIDREVDLAAARHELEQTMRQQCAALAKLVLQLPTR